MSHLTCEFRISIDTYRHPLPVIPMPKGALAMLVLRVLRSGPLHGYAIAQRIRHLSGDVLGAEEGSLFSGAAAHLARRRGRRGVRRVRDRTPCSFLQIDARWRAN